MAEKEKHTKPLMVGIGEVLWDVLPEGRRLGGAPANFAYHCSVHGAESRIVSAVGADDEGSDILDELSVRKISTEFVATVKEYRTGMVNVELDGGIPTYTIEEPAAWDYIPFTDEVAQLAKETDAVCFGSLAQRKKASAAAIKLFMENTKPDCLKVFDVNLRQEFYSRKTIEESLRLCNMLKISNEELPCVLRLLYPAEKMGEDETSLQKLAEDFSLKWIVLTKGPEGAIFFDGENLFSTPAFDYGPCVDTVGCGDSFTATLTCGLLAGLPAKEAMEKSSRVAGLVCASTGATPEIPEELKISMT